VSCTHKNTHRRISHTQAEIEGNKKSHTQAETEGNSVKIAQLEEATAAANRQIAAAKERLSQLVL
jgi:hypothetical protein